MSLWGNKDLAADAPLYTPVSQANNIYFVDLTEAANANNRSNGIKTPGWNSIASYTDAANNVRHKVESLIPMKVTAAFAGDVGATNPFNATLATVGGQYVIVTVGTTDYTLVGAAANTVGLSFTATGPATGTGTIRLDQNAVVAGV